MVEKKDNEQAEKLKRMLVQKGVRTGMGLALAGLTGGLSIVDATLEILDITNAEEPN